MGETPHKAVGNHFPRVRGNRTSVAPGVVFNPTTGCEGVKTPPPPPPNDSLKASLSPPVGGRLGSFRNCIILVSLTFISVALHYFIELLDLVMSSLGQNMVVVAT